MTISHADIEAVDPRSGSGPTIRPAGPADIEPILALLAAAHLPAEGAAEALANGVVAVMAGSADGAVTAGSGDGAGRAAAEAPRVVGAAAIEAYGADGLLRSVVVEPTLRGTGVGHALVAAAEARAASTGVRDLYLLTETAASWFARLGYEPLDRSAAPSAIAGSWEFRVGCVDTGVLMRRRLSVS